MDPARRMVPHEPAVAPCWAAPARAVSPDYRQAPAIRGENRHVSLGPRGSPQAVSATCVRAAAAAGALPAASDGTAPGGAAGATGRLPQSRALPQEEDSKPPRARCPSFAAICCAGPSLPGPMLSSRRHFFTRVFSTCEICFLQPSGAKAVPIPCEAASGLRCSKSAQPQCA